MKLAKVCQWLMAAMLSGVLAACAVNSPAISPEATGSLPDKAEARVGAGTAQSPPASSPGRGKVALLLPLTGPGNVAVLARAMKQAGEMALFERPVPDFQLLVKDDRGTPEGARTAAEEALREGAELILGPLLAASVDAVAPVAAAARVPVIAFSNDRRVARPGVHLLSFMPEHDVERIVGYAMAQGRRSFAALLPDDAYGRIVEETFTRAVAAGQGNVAAIERYNRGGSPGMLEATRKLGEALSNRTDDGVGTADALLMPGEPDSLLSLGPLIAYARIDTTRLKLLGTGGWDAPNVGRDPTFVGAWYAAPDPRGWQSFSERFAKTFGTAPPRIASVAYDAVGVAMALSGAPAATRFTETGITRPSGFAGIDGTVRFLADGTAARALAVHEVQAFGSRVIDQPASAPSAGPSASAIAPRTSGRPAQVN
jgi:branched-chain amino acid transport system substrate-binding protein